METGRAGHGGGKGLLRELQAGLGGCGQLWARCSHRAGKCTAVRCGLWKRREAAEETVNCFAALEAVLEDRQELLGTGQPAAEALPRAEEEFGREGEFRRERLEEELRAEVEKLTEVMGEEVRSVAESRRVEAGKEMKEAEQK